MRKCRRTCGMVLLVRNGPARLSNKSAGRCRNGAPGLHGRCMRMQVERNVALSHCEGERLDWMSARHWRTTMPRDCTSLAAFQRRHTAPLYAGAALARLDALTLHAPPAFSHKSCTQPLAQGMLGFALLAHAERDARIPSHESACPFRVEPPSESGNHRPGLRRTDRAWQTKADDCDLRTCRPSRPGDLTRRPSLIHNQNGCKQTPL